MRTTNTTTARIRLSLEEVKAMILSKICIPGNATEPDIEVDDDGAVVSFTYTQEEEKEEEKGEEKEEEGPCLK